MTPQWTSELLTPSKKMLLHPSELLWIEILTWDAFAGGPDEAEYIETPKRRADVLTKSLSVSAWDSALKLLHIMSPETWSFYLPSEFCIPYAFRVLVLRPMASKTWRFFSLQYASCIVDVTKSHLL